MSPRITLVLAVMMNCSAAGIRAGWPALGPPPTMRQEAAEAKFILYGKLSDPVITKDGGGQTTFHVELVVKPGPDYKGEKVLVIPRAVEATTYLIYFDVFKGTIDPYRGFKLQSDAGAKYLKDALALDPTKPGAAVDYFHRHLESPDPVVSEDAYRELHAMKYAELRGPASRLPADAITTRLAKQDRKPWHCALDGLLLGHCGKDHHAEVLSKLIATARKEETSSGLEGLLVGCTLLRPHEGLALIRDVIGRDKSFTMRLEALRALRFFVANRPDVVPRTAVVPAMALMLEQQDIADMVVDDLRSLGEVTVMEQVLSLEGRKDFDIPIMHRAVLRYALTFPKNARAKEHVDKARARDPDLVESVEEMLKLEKEAEKHGP